MANVITEQLHACAKAAKRLMQDGIHGPKVEEIARQAHGDLWPVGKEDIDWITKHLPGIKLILETEEDLSVCLVNRDYYTRFHRRMPGTIEAAKLVLPKRGSYRAAGLHFVTTEGDTIWLASTQKLGEGGIGVIRKVQKNVVREVSNNRLSSVNGEKFVRTLKDKL
jgi:hypothetical protein